MKTITLDEKQERRLRTFWNEHMEAISRRNPSYRPQEFDIETALTHAILAGLQFEKFRNAMQTIKEQNFL